MKLEKILKLGNPLLYEKSQPVLRGEINSLLPVINELRDILLEFRELNNYGRAIASPQIGVLKKIIFMHINDKSSVIINPVLSNFSEEMFELWDDCLCFPNLLVRVKRHQSCTLKFVDENWVEHEWQLEGDLSELIQHEYDHLEGILATQRAIDDKSFKIR